MKRRATTLRLCTFETDMSCAACKKPGRMAWGALCADCEDIVATFTPEEWERVERMSADEADRYVQDHPAKERLRRELYDAYDLCPASELNRDECPHCTGNLEGLA